jgi:hypothetical protein
MGCCPFDHETYLPQSDSQNRSINIRSLITIDTTRCGSRVFSALPSIDNYLRLALKLFRGEPAITRLDWNFTTSHNSSAGIVTNVGSVLHKVLPLLQPDHG